MTPTKFTHLLVLAFALVLVVGCGSGEPVVIQPTEDYQPTEAEAAFEAEVEQMREQRDELDQ